MGRKNNDQTLAYLAQIEALLNQIARNQDVDHEALVNIDVRTRDNIDMSEAVMNDVATMQTRLSETVGVMMNHADRDVQTPYTPRSSAQFEPSSMMADGASVDDDPFADSDGKQPSQKGLQIKIDPSMTGGAEVVPAQVIQPTTPATPVSATLSVEEIARNPFFMDIFQNVRDTHAVVKRMSQDLAEVSRMLYDSYRYASPELIATLQSQTPGKKRILLVGFYGAPNLGDELMCLTVLDYLREKLPDAEFTVMCTNSDSFNYADAYFGANILHYPRGYYDENVIANSFDAVIVGGGALIDDSFAARGGNAPGTMNIGRVAVELPKAFGMMGKPAAMLGLSTNDELKDPQYIDTAVTAIAGTRITTIRDPYSLKTLVDCGAPEDRMALCPDIVASDKILYEVLRDTRMLLEEENESIKAGNAPQDDRKRIMVTWIASDQESMPRLASIVEAVAIKNMEMDKDVHVCLVPFLQEFNTDENMATALRAILSDGANDILETPKYTEDIGIVCDTISACDYAMNMRYHGGFLAALLGLPGIVVTWEGHRHYPNKMKYLSEQFANLEQVGCSRLDAMTEVDKAFSVIFADDVEKELDELDGSAFATTAPKYDDAENLFIFEDDDNDDIDSVKMIAKSLVNAMPDQFGLPESAIDDPTGYADEIRQENDEKKTAAKEESKAAESEQPKTTMEKRIARLNEAEKICLEAQEKMETITSRLVKSINKQN